jgi:hypothetical protein
MLSSCASPLHEHFAVSKFDSRVYKKVYNDSLQVYLQFPGDVAFETSPKKAEKKIKQTKGCFGKLVRDQKDILLWGETVIEPHYAFVVSVYSDVIETPTSRPCEQVFDSTAVAGGYTFRITALNADPKYRDNYIKDLEKVLSLIQAGKDYPEIY